MLDFETTLKLEKENKQNKVKIKVSDEAEKAIALDAYGINWL